MAKSMSEIEFLKDGPHLYPIWHQKCLYRYTIRMSPRWFSKRPSASKRKQLEGSNETEIEVPDTYDSLFHNLNQIKESLTFLAVKLAAHEMNVQDDVPHLKQQFPMISTCYKCIVSLGDITCDFIKIFIFNRKRDSIREMIYNQMDKLSLSKKWVLQHPQFECLDKFLEHNREMAIGVLIFNLTSELYSVTRYRAKDQWNKDRGAWYIWQFIPRSQSNKRVLTFLLVISQHMKGLIC